MGDTCAQPVDNPFLSVYNIFASEGNIPIIDYRIR